MTVYVDDMNLQADVPNGDHVVRGKWSHLMADSEEELREFARRLGLRASWIQHPGEPGVHFDVTAGKRAQAIRLGATAITWRQAGEMHAQRLQGAVRGRPEGASRSPVANPVAAEDLGLLPDPTGTAPPLLVTASRDGLSEADVESALRPHFAPGRTLISGNARGGDRLAEDLWERWGGTVDRNPVAPEAWQQSRGAGYQRDAAMVAKARQAGGECVAIIAQCARVECVGASPHGSHGAVNTAGMAGAAGMPVDRVKAGPPSRPAAAAEPVARKHGRHYPAEMPLPEDVCPGCRSATLTSGRTSCQACDVVAGYQPAEATYPDVSHGQPGHMCVLPGGSADATNRREAEAV